MNETMSSQIDSSRTVYEFAGLANVSGWWLWAALIGSLALIVFLCVQLYRRDVGNLPPSVGRVLILMRLISIAVLVFFFLDIQRRTQREIVRPSEVVVLVDTSQSMALAQDDNVGSISRSQRVARILDKSDLLETLDGEHRVSVYSVGAADEPVLLRSGQLPVADQESAENAAAESGSQERGKAGDLSTMMICGIMALVVCLIASVISLIQGIAQTLSPGGSQSRLGFLFTIIAVSWCLGITLCGTDYSVQSERSFPGLLGMAETEAAESEDEQEPVAGEPQPEAVPQQVVLDWQEAVVASAAQSRIGDAIEGVLATHDPTTLAGLVLLSDGQNNGGRNLSSVLGSLRRTEIPVYPVGLGSSRPPTNVRVVDLDVPKRVYPEDKFAISAVLQATGGGELTFDVQLLDELEVPESDGGKTLPTEVVDAKTVTIPADGTLSGVKFELQPASVGKRHLAIRVIPPAKDQNESDDARDARYEVVARKMRVLTVAGGPTREYRFVRNLLHREASIRLDTWLQTGQQGMSQDADALLDEFPDTAAEMFEYDAVVMFDPDWTKIPAESIDLLDRWLASQAGGLVIVAGPVFHPRWQRLRTDPRVSKIAGFFPVTFSGRGLFSSSGREGGQDSWPLDFTPESRRADFLWVTDDARGSFEVWDRFGGVYDYVGVKSAKPASKVYAYFSDPTTMISDSLPVYLASQFYGAGRVFFQGSGEMWRLRRESDVYFDSYYTKLVRWVSEGRLLRDSNRGVMLVDNNRAMVGDTISVRAVLTDEQFEPLELPEVKAKLLSPNGRIVDVRLTPVQEENKPGTYGGRFIVRETGNYQLLLTLGAGRSEVVLEQNVQVGLPEMELERPKRNDGDLQTLADIGGGSYLKIDPGVDDRQVSNELTENIVPQPQLTILPGTPDPLFTERRNAVILWLIAGILTMEWVIRRLHKLA
ncbi:hypothetical protein SV7mr_28830 [Stieleria bergensis]|uniref:von Willebrand factor type A domain protein n=2 Tax=Stieleria bergensis TaxID=2528025 RepID=A0A517SW48_9BACT|nr:hypothetical protein SV7mr_28830 [Planctomycetes bacterium SV_7m_r]